MEPLAIPSPVWSGTSPSTLVDCFFIHNSFGTRKNDRCTRVQNLDKYRTEAAQREKLSKDLVMREHLNRKSRLLYILDGTAFCRRRLLQERFVPASHRTRRQTSTSPNIARLRKLNEEGRYTEDFWDASNRLKLHDGVIGEQSELNDVNKQLAEATRQYLQDRRLGPPKHHRNHVRATSKKGRLCEKLGRSTRPFRRGLRLR